MSFVSSTNSTSSISTSWESVDYAPRLTFFVDLALKLFSSEEASPLAVVCSVMVERLASIERFGFNSNLDLNRLQNIHELLFTSIAINKIIKIFIS